MSLEPGAAASLERLEAAHGVVPINSAYRPVSEQQALIDFWDNPNPGKDGQGRPLNRPPYLYAPRRPASSGLHVSGRAIDTEWAITHRALMAEYGFMFNYEYDKVHLEYEKQHDKHINDKPKPNGKAVITGVDNVDIIISFSSKNSRNGITVCAPGLVKKLTAEQWGNGAIQKALKGVPVIVPVNDREFDILTDMYR